MSAQRRAPTSAPRPQRTARSAVYLQSFSVRYEFPVYFTEHLFARDNPVFRDTLLRREPGRRHRFVVFVDANVAAVVSVAGARHRRLRRPCMPKRMELAGAARGGARRRAGQERPGAADPAAAAAGRTRHRPPCLRRRHRRRRLPRPDRLCRCRPPIAASAISACRPRCWRRTTPASASRTASTPSASRTCSAASRRRSPCSTTSTSCARCSRATRSPASPRR